MPSRPIGIVESGAGSLLDIEKIQKLIEVMVANDLTEISLRDGDMEVNLRRPTVREGNAVPVATGQPVAGVPATNSASAPQQPSREATSGEEATELVEVKAPMVGTFYAASDPDSPPLVHAGSKVTPSTVVCLLEAMKVFSEIKAEVAGTIERILVKNSEPVEYGQAMFLVRVG